MKLISLVKANDGIHKFVATVSNAKGEHKVRFGAKGYSDYTKHKDDARKQRYIIRHRTRENWTKTGILTAGFWSRWVLWNQKTLSASIRDVERRFLDGPSLKNKL